MEKKSQLNFSSDELEALTCGAVTYCCTRRTRVIWWRQLHV